MEYSLKIEDLDFTDEFNALSDQVVSHCNQCGKCTAGCPVVEEMDYTPNQVLRLCQLGKKDELLNSRTIWTCLSCETCTTRCPKNIDIARVMDALRILARREGITPQERDIAALNEVFLDTVRRNGRLQESIMAMRYNLRTGNFFKDLDIGRQLFLKGKLNPFASAKIKGSQEIENIFLRSRPFLTKE